MDIITNDVAWIGLIALLPLIGGLINGIFGSRLPGKLVNLIGCGAVFGSFFIAAKCVVMLQRSGAEHLSYTAYQWIYSGDVHVDLAFMIDPLSAVMVLVVTGVGALIHVYSTGYMSHDPGKWKYFSFLNLFVFAMLLLILGKNMLVTFIGWEGVGACSYLLIGFWYTDEAKAVAGQKAFIVNRVGDFAFLAGLFLLYWEAGTFDYVELMEMSTTLEGAARIVPVALPAVLLIFIGCTGKSAQIPLYTWLPDAMAGPTPVSALIHAATMVTSGVYLLARLNFIVTMSWEAMLVISVVGALTALMAASIALVQNDIKGVLAYSTVSQLGYMFIGIGTGAFVGAIFHLMTHAFFKALLFLGSGSVIHAMDGEQDIRKMGGLKKWMPITRWTFLIACLAIAGVPFFAGFFSKDLILWGAFSNVHVFQISGVEQLGAYLTGTQAQAIAGGGPLEVATASTVVYTAVWLIGLFTAMLTAFYMFRLYLLTFEGRCRADEETKAHLHESPTSMALPLMVLAILSVIGGYIGVPHVVAHLDVFHNMTWMLGFEHWLEPVFDNSMTYRIANRFGSHPESMEVLAIALSVLAAGLGIGGAFLLYVFKPGLLDAIHGSTQFGYKVLVSKYKVDEAYDFIFVRGTILCGKIDYLFDQYIVDGLVNGVGFVGESIGRILRNLQSGDVQRYATYIVLAVVLVMVALL